MKIIKFFIPLVLCAFLPVNIIAQESDSERFSQYWAKIEQNALYEDRTWLRLLHFPIENPDRQSAILTNDFFLSESHNARDELKALLTLLLKNDVEENVSLYCRFPARFYWLKQRLQISDAEFTLPYCKKLEEWAKFSDLQSISLIMVSAYYGNPASAFGHVLIKLNNGGYSDSGDLLDQGVNFGALVPDNENPIIYILKGLFGGYAAGFSDKKFYTQDLVYTGAENRDMWEYHLDLSDYQQRLFVYHLWELVGAKYQYFFLKENCGYRVAELVELALDDASFRDTNAPWYLPISIFHRLEELQSEENQQLIRQMDFLPSNQHQLYTQVEELSAAQVRYLNALIIEPERLTSAQSDLSTLEQAEVLDALITYYNYQSASEFGDEKDPEIVALKEKVLQKRLLLPVNPQRFEFPIAQHPSPALGSKPGVMRFGLATQTQLGSYNHLDFAAVVYDVVGRQFGRLNNGELRALELSVLLKDSELYIDEFILGGATKLNLRPSALVGEKSFSWRIRTGFRRKTLDCLVCQTFYAEAGIGQALALTGQAYTYALMNGVYEAKDNDWRLEPELNVVTEFSERLKLRIQALTAFNVVEREQRNQLATEIRYTLQNNHDLRFNWQQREGVETRLSYEYRW